MDSLAVSLAPPTYTPGGAILYSERNTSKRIRRRASVSSSARQIRFMSDGRSSRLDREARQPRYRLVFRRSIARTGGRLVTISARRSDHDFMALAHRDGCRSGGSLEG